MKKSILHTVERRKVYSIVHLVLRNCLLKQVEVSGRRGIRCKQLLDDFKEKFWKWKMMHQPALSGELAVEEATGRSQDRTTTNDIPH